MWFHLLGECVISSGLSHHSKDLKQQTGVTARLKLRVLFGKQRIICPSGMRVGRPQRRGLNPSRRSLFIRFCLLPPKPAQRKLGWPGRLFVSPEVLTPVHGFSFVPFSWAFPFHCLLATVILDSIFTYLF